MELLCAIYPIKKIILVSIRSHILYKQNLIEINGNL